MTNQIVRGCNYILKNLYWFGLGKLVRRIQQEKITIVTMHGVMAPHADMLWHPLRDQLSPQALERTIRVLSKHYTFISLAQAKAILVGDEPGVKNGLVFTLDDGYWNNLSYAGQVFKKYAIKPTIFVATKNIDECSPFWFDRLDYALQQLSGDRYTVILHNKRFIFNTQSRRKLQLSYAKFRMICKASFTYDAEMRTYLDQIALQIEAATGKALANIIGQDDWTRLANWQQLAASSNNGEFDIGSHTVDHIRIALTSYEECLTQLSDSKIKIEQHLAMPCRYFSYPDGSFNARCTKMVANAGYELAVTVENGLNATGDNLMTLKRFSLPTHDSDSDILHAVSNFKLSY